MNLQEQQAVERMEVEIEVLRSDIRHKDEYIAWLEARVDELEDKLGERE